MTETTVGRGEVPRQIPTTGEQPLPTRRSVRLEGNVAAAPPPRPRLTSDLAPPSVTAAVRRPRSVQVAGVLSWTATLTAVAGLLAMLLDRDALDARLTATVSADDPTASAELVAETVRATIGLVVGIVGLALLVTVIWAVLAQRQRSWARWPLIGTALLTLFALVVAQDVAAGGAAVDRAALGIAAALLLLAPVPLFSRSARAWFAARVR